MGRIYEKTPITIDKKEYLVSIGYGIDDDTDDNQLHSLETSGCEGFYSSII